MAKQVSGGGRAIAPEVGVPEIDEAVIGTAGVVGGGALIVSMLGAKIPLTGLPQGAFFDCMSRLISTAPKAIWEFWLCPMM